MVGAHASFTMSDQSMSACVEMANNLGTGVHIHVAEDPVDERITRELYGCGLIERFERSGLLTVDNTILAHGTHLSPSDILRVNEFCDTVALAHNPRSNMNNGVGYAPVIHFQRSPMLGTDGMGADMWTEARTAQFKSHDAALPLPFGRPLEMLAESARFASRLMGVKLGVLEAGAAADLVLTSYRPATPLTSDSLAGHFIYAMSTEHVSDVMVDGQWCLRQTKAVTCDEAATRQTAVGIAKELHSRMTRLPLD